MKTIIIDGIEYNLTPKARFKKGDWVVRYGETLQISGIDTVLDGTFHYWFTKGTWLSSKKMENARLWTIQDAKDGDVLAAHECYVIFKEIDGLNIKCYCTYHYLGFNPSFYVDTLQNKTAFYPATKEQRDTLEMAMTNAGYTFDFEKKELKKIEQTPAEWSEEDERVKGNCIAYINEYKKTIQHPEIIGISECLNWLKSLRPKSQWKPSEEQISVLSRSLKYINTISKNYCHVLGELLAQLKKLREE